ncbi:TOG array regulator of axonemal microtubules protein 2-like [Vidua chalybeata]|uniref:TOG array regulator of axonemal microtubules protein 2-like n=1 Tax=Vidua chalybeata TaxID=81927 RepID=UPI0023A82E26|nr:TOG array regulator of axonemal microtubules protein 2-like [Vidua chalybeata]XP_053789688.1 TOG array regulator of axonemal microtubules protein 2-like [Vidua chalybeata]
MDLTGKGKTTEGKGLTGYPLAKRFSLASPSMLLPSKPLPPIQKSSPSTKPSQICSGEQENGKHGSSYEKKQELSSEGTGCKTSLLYSSGGVMQKGSLGPPLIPPIRKAISPTLGSTAGSLQSSLQLEFQESQEMRPTSSSRSKEENCGHAGFSLPPVDGTASGVQRKHPGSGLKKVLRKQDNVPLLPNMPIIHGHGSFPRNSSVTSQTATGAERREEPLCGKGQKDTASADPQQSLREALSLLGSDDWELKEKGLFNIRHLAGSHSEVLLCRLGDVCLAVTSEVTNLRSKVSYSAIVTLGELFVTLKKDMDSEVDEVVRVLLQMVWNSPEFVQKAASQTLGIMVENVTPARAMTALMDMGVKSRHVQVRKCAAELLLSLMERIGVTRLAGTPRAERLAHVAGKLAQDCHKDTRHYGQEMVKMLLNHQKFKMLLERSLSTCGLEDILTRMKKKGMENQKGECPPVKELVKKRSDGSKKPQATLSSSKRVKSTSDGCLLHRAKAQVTLPPAVEETELLQKLYSLLEAKGFQTRMEGVALLQDLCKTSPQLISTNIVQIFDYFVLRISDSHKKVKQKALDVLAEITGVLKEALNPVIIGLVEGITKSLNSKDPRVRASAVKALEESIAHLDKVSLLKEFSYQWNQLSGQALLDVAERITVLVEWVYARSPEVVQHDALPVLWSFLENKALPVRSANVRTVATKLASALYKVMGSKLKKCAASKPPHVQDNLSKILGW